MQPTKERFTPDTLIKLIVLFRISLFALLLFMSNLILAQKIEVLNEKGKKIYTIKQWKNIDFRIDYKKLYPENQNDIVESRMFSYIDSIDGNRLHIVENQVVLNFKKDNFDLVEQEYEYTDLWIELGDIKSMSFTPTMAAIGDALLWIGAAAAIASPLLGFTPDGYSTQRFAQVAGIGLGTAVIGGALSLTFGQKPVKFKEFDGPDYYKKYQKGSISSVD